MSVPQRARLRATLRSPLATQVIRPTPFSGGVGHLVVRWTARW